MSESHPERREDARHVSRAPAPGPRRRRMAEWWGGVRPLLIPLSIVGAMLVLGASAARDPEIESSTRLGEELRLTRSALLARQGELELARLEMNRLSSIVDYSARYRIPADLATAIFDMATTEGVEPALAFSLIRVESGFTRRAVSSAGAVGYTQVMPSTAYWLQPGIGREELFDRDINLRLGFRYLRMMIEQYDGDLHLALLAYNRGPGRVDEILRAGGDPSNGYSLNVRRGLAGATSRAIRLRGD